MITNSVDIIAKAHSDPRRAVAELLGVLSAVITHMHDADERERALLALTCPTPKPTPAKDMTDAYTIRRRFRVAYDRLTDDGRAQK